ncbi:MAG: hypothetical protein PHR83_12425 [Paludibacter sp.]|nr:hypothetical protein [Paludibacter sp.]
MENSDTRIFSIVGKLIEKLTKMTYSYQKEIMSKCEFEACCENDARIALMGFVRAELISTYFQFCNIRNLYFQSDIKLNFLRKPLSAELISNNDILAILISSLRQRTKIAIYTLLESGNRFYFNEGSFDKYRLKFDETLNNGFEILRFYRNSMHNNGIFFGKDGQDFDVSYREYWVHFENGKTMHANYKLDYLILKDSITLFKQFALNSLEINPQYTPIDSHYNLDSYKPKTIFQDSYGGFFFDIFEH